MTQTVPDTPAEQAFVLAESAVAAAVRALDQAEAAEAAAVRATRSARTALQRAREAYDHAARARAGTPPRSPA